MAEGGAPLCKGRSSQRRVASTHSDKLTCGNTGVTLTTADCFSTSVEVKYGGWRVASYTSSVSS